MNKILLGALAALVILLGSFLGTIQQTPKLAGAAAGLQTYDGVNATTSVRTLSATVVTSTFVLGPTATTNIIPAGTSVDNGNRKNATIQNTGSAFLFCKEENVASSGASTVSSSSYGFAIAPSSTSGNIWSAQTGGSLYVGQVWCVDTATTTFAVQENN